MINGELIVDSFAGGGGASTGIELATGISVDIAINHDPEAIRMHKTNHPGTKHYCESVWDVDPEKVCNGHPVALAWFSPDCKHFSKAKGGKPKDKNIRGLAWVALRWAGKVRPRVIMLENVEEFKTWGPLNRGRRPIKAKQGMTFRKFVCQLEKLGYVVEYRELVAADYGAPTMRKRFFLVARCDGKPIVWPEPTHAPADSPEVAAGLREPYIGAYTQIDFSLPCPSIFDTAEEIKEKYGIRAVRPLAPKTMDRIARGLKKFVLDNQEPFIIQCNHGGERKPQDIREPMPTITGKHGFGVVEPYLVQIGQTGFAADRSKDVREPLTTIVSKNEHCLVAPTLIQYHSETSKEEVRGQGIEDPIMTVDASNRYGLVTSFLSKFYSNGTGQDMREPLGTLTADAGGGHFAEVRAFLIKYYGGATGQDIKEPLDTVTSHDRFGLVTIQGVDYQIVDIGLRMLEPKELYGCQGFPDDYIIDRDYTWKSYPRSEQVRRCGNAVCPPIPAALVRAVLDGRKTMTRRVIKPRNRKKAKEQGYCQGSGLWVDTGIDNWDKEWHIKDYSISSCWMSYSWYLNKYAPYKPGDILYVRETYSRLSVKRNAGYTSHRYVYKASDTYPFGEKYIIKFRWHPSIHMPKEAARIWLKVTDVRVERLQEISDEQAIREGISKLYDYLPDAEYLDWAKRTGIYPKSKEEWGYKNYLWHGNFGTHGTGNKMSDAWDYQYSCYDSARDSFSSLWNTTVPLKEWDIYGWLANPWVWVIEFERCEKPESEG